MAEPQIKYVRTSDGVNIAYFTMGEGGPPLVMMDVMYSHLQAEMANPRSRRQYEGIARLTTLVRDDRNVYGGAVNIAARIAGASAPGEVLVSATVRELARTSAGVMFEDRGEREMKGVGEPVRVYAVRGWG